jgi:hypothetical protein
MKIKLTGKTKQIASALLVTLVICSILSIFVMYYLSLIDQQSFLSARSQTWNMAIAVSEAGVEDGLQQLNNNWPNIGSDGWAYDSLNNWYSRSNTLPDGSSYVASIIMTNILTPVVTSRAYVQQPVQARFAAGGVTVQPTTVSRCVQVTTQKKNLFIFPLMSKRNINLNGNNITIDSFDSSDPNKSTNGAYDPAKYRGDKGDVATDLGVIDSLGAGNANIYGHAHTGPGSPTTAVQIGNNGAIGSHLWQASNTGIEPGWWLPDANFTFPDTQYPSTTGYLTPSNGVVVTMTFPVTTNNYNNVVTYPSPVPWTGVGTNYIAGPAVKNWPVMPAPGTYVPGTAVQDPNTKFWNYTSLAGLQYSYSLYTTNTIYSTNNYDHILWGNSAYTNNYVATDLSGSTIVCGPNVNLALPNGFQMGSHDSILLTKDGTVVGGPPGDANVISYSGGTSCSLSGQGLINQPGYSGNFVVYCASTVTTLLLAGNAGFNGCIVAPSVDVTLNGGGSSPTDYAGCLMCNTITLNGHYNFHFDEALLGANKSGRFLILAWNEIR